MTLTHDAINELFQGAVKGSVDAQLRLADLSLVASQNGAVGQLEGLTGAELWARFAATSGRADAISVLGEVLTARALFDDARDLPDCATWYRTEATRRRERAGLDGAGADVDLSPQPHDDVHVAAAAQGDLVALGALLDDAAQRLKNGRCEPIEWLVVTEIYARIAAARGAPGSLAKLASVIGRRADFELRQGNGDLAFRMLAEGITLISILADNGDADKVSMLEAMVEDLTAGGVVQAITGRPSILKHVVLRGSC